MMKHLGDITKISGYEVPIVDIVTGGSPCQDLSVAGLRKGLEGERSGLFMEQIRIIKEMREYDKRTNSRSDVDVRPRYMVWENVPGAFTSNKGDDFRCVLEETAKIAAEDASIPRPEGGRWNKAGCVVGDGWSLAWRLHDAQFWGVPQRRKRICLLADFNGDSAPKILFELFGETIEGDGDKAVLGVGEEPRSEVQPLSESLRGNTEKSGQEGQATSRSVEEGIDSAIYSIGHDIRSARFTPDEITDPLTATDYKDPIKVLTSQSVQGFDSYNLTSTGQVSKTLQAERSDNEHLSIVCVENKSEEKTAFFEAYQHHGYREGNNCNPLTSKQNEGVRGDTPLIYDSVVRRLTPLECERLQGYPDQWTNIGEWTDSKGKKRKDSDTPRYKALGNSIALPFWRWMAERIVSEYDRQTTMASLFDGIGGFPLVFSEFGCKPLWASEIEDFPVAVTKIRFSEDTE